MKMISTLIMTLLISTAVYAGDCDTVGGECSSAEKCTALGTRQSKNLILRTEGTDKGKCMEMTQQSSTDCKSIAQSTGAKAQGPASTESSTGAASSNTAK